MAPVIVWLSLFTQSKINKNNIDGLDDWGVNNLDVDDDAVEIFVSIELSSWFVCHDVSISYFQGSEDTKPNIFSFL